MPVPILFLSDTHLGFDLPSRPRVERGRRGEDFFESFERALAPAYAGEVSVVVHGGDLFYRSRIPAWLADRVFSRLADLAESGVDLFWVPGNHERSGVPRSLLLTHPRIHVFDRPRTFVVERDGVRVALSGFPFSPRARAELPSLLVACGDDGAEADVRLLCLHQAVEGAVVGTHRFVFRGGDEVVACRDLPSGFSAVLSGHVHRYQVLTRDLEGRPLPAPVLFAGSTERTSFAERDEPKGTVMLEAETGGGPRLAWRFRELPVRPMADLEVDPAAPGLDARLREGLAALDPRSVVRVRLCGTPSPGAIPSLRAAALREIVPATMSISVAWPTGRPAG